MFDTTTNPAQWHDWAQPQDIITGELHVVGTPDPEFTFSTDAFRDLVYKLYRKKDEKENILPLAGPGLFDSYCPPVHITAADLDFDIEHPDQPCKFIRKPNTERDFHKLRFFPVSSHVLSVPHKDLEVYTGNYKDLVHYIFQFFSFAVRDIIDYMFVDRLERCMLSRKEEAIKLEGSNLLEGFGKVIESFHGQPYTVLANKLSPLPDKLDRIITVTSEDVIPVNTYYFVPAITEDRVVNHTLMAEEYYICSPQAEGEDWQFYARQVRGSFITDTSLIAKFTLV